MSSVGKRKRYSKDIKCVFFPDDVRNVKKVGGERPTVSASSVNKSWQKCGDSFLDTALTPRIQKSSAVRPLLTEQFTSVQCGVGGGCDDEDPVHIAWSSSESEQSDGEARPQPQPPPSLRTKERRARPRRPVQATPAVQSYSWALRMLSTSTDELPAIDWDSDQSESEGEAERKESVEEISDCQSEACERQKKTSEPPAVTEMEISDYTSDGESAAADETLDQSRLDQSRLDQSRLDHGRLDQSGLDQSRLDKSRLDQSRLDQSGLDQSLPLQAGVGSSTRSVSDWVRSAQAMLRTPQKQTERNAKTPEDSTKKRRKFHSGGLAERLNRLECRQRSAISFWRHQSISDAATATADKPGVLVLEVLSIRAETSMLLALCEQHQPPTTDHHTPPPSSTAGRAVVLALFNKATAAQLMPAPRDVIHIYPPWQRLVMEGETTPVILNTHFSQKVFSAAACIPRSMLPVDKRTPYSLSTTFSLLNISKTSEEQRVPIPQSVSCRGTVSGACDSLLEAIEGWGQVGSVGQAVEVVVQRVYSIPLQERSTLLRPKLPCRSPSAPPPQKANCRLCALVQDSCGMFSVVQLRPLPDDQDHLQHYTQRWQGRACLLTALKVVRRVTRERCPRLFSLIDSLWPLQISHGNKHVSEDEGRVEGLAPSFCYLLSGGEGSVEPLEELAVSPLYLPPAQHTLRDILQSEHKSHRCSFIATVVYKGAQSQCGVVTFGRSEVWLVVTDASLQEETSDPPCSRTLPLCLDTSCVLTSPVVTALLNPAPCQLLFRDAVLEQGVMLCVEQSVVGLPSPLRPGCPTEENTTRSQATVQAAQAPLYSLPLPLRLDPLGPEATPNSLCSLSGVIVGVDEDTAYSWPVCSLCGSDRLEIAQEVAEVYHCVTCNSPVNRPTMKMQLEAFMSCSSLSDCTVKVKLQQNTIMSILNSANGDNEFPGYEVENVLGKEVGPINAYVRVVTRKPTLWMGLEEICL